jgi:hypothetical protein
VRRWQLTIFPVTGIATTHVDRDESALPMLHNTRIHEEQVPAKACLKVSMTQKEGSKGSISFKRSFYVGRLVYHNEINQ